VGLDERTATCHDATRDDATCHVAQGTGDSIANDRFTDPAVLIPHKPGEMPGRGHGHFLDIKFIEAARSAQT
jgi:hypothetical protein